MTADKRSARQLAEHCGSRRTGSSHFEHGDKNEVKHDILDRR